MHRKNLSLVNASESYPSHMNAPKSSLQVNALESYPSHLNAPKKSLSSKCIGILPLTHECTKIIIPQVNAPESYPSHRNAPKSSILTQMHRNSTPHTWMHRNHHSSSKCTGILPLTHECTANRHPFGKCTNILPLTHECTDTIIPRVKHRNLIPHTWMHRKSSSLM